MGIYSLFQSLLFEVSLQHTVLISFNPIEVMLNLEQNLGGERPTSALKLTRAKTAPEIEVKQNKISQEVTEEYEISPTKSAPKIPSGNDRTKLRFRMKISFQVLKYKPLTIQALYFTYNDGIVIPGREQEGTAINLPGAHVL